jgi:outer membrane protein OmpA-like peptidoglycan-associated protein
VTWHFLSGSYQVALYGPALARTLQNEAASGPLDLLAALATATRDVSPPATLIVVSSGLSTAGGFDLLQVGWDAKPSSVAAQLKAQELLPDLTGWHVIFSGLGDVAGRQPALPQPQQSTLTAYWTAICQASDAASCSVDKTPRPQLASHVTSMAPVVPVPAVTSVRGSALDSVVTTLPDTLLFQPGSTTLDTYADKILQPIVQQALSQHLLVSITGYTSPDGGSNAYNLALSAQRAHAVSERLIALGLAAEQITQVTGAGTAGKGPDACVVNGHLDEAMCAQLRRVVVILSPAKANS